MTLTTLFKQLIESGKAELVGSGYAQLIGPLVPARVVAANLKIGNEIYRDLLGIRPTLALVNEQAYSGGLVGHYLDAGYTALLMDWDNPAAAHPEWDAESRYRPQRALGAELTHTLMKCETHNHPTAISPFPGAATGSGGEIRDEAATGRGAKPKAGLCGFSVSHLRIPGFEQPWEAASSRPGRIASALQIMLEGPIGAASFNNEFGRPNLTGYFRAFEMQVDGVSRGYHKPIMIAGGIGNISAAHSYKSEVTPGALLVHSSQQQRQHCSYMQARSS